MLSRWDRWSTGGAVGPPIAAFLVAYGVQRDAADVLGPVLAYFAVPYAIAFPLFRRVPIRGVLPGLIAVLVGLAIAYFGFWFGGMGVGAGLAVALALPRRRGSPVEG